MNLLLLFPILSCIVCCVLAVTILGRAPHRIGRLGAALMVASAFWALCETLWTAATDAEAALWLVRIASIGWISIGPITLHLFLELSGHPLRRRGAFIAVLYGTNAALVASTLATPWVDVEAIRMDWGWAYRVGPMFPVVYLFTGVTFFSGLLIGLRDSRTPLLLAERRQANLLVAGMVAGLLVASITDGLLPALGIYVPRMGVVAIAVFACTVGWGFQRYGYSLLAPGVFSSEILATLPDGVALLRIDGRIRFVNRSLERLAGAPSGRLEGRPIEALMPDFRFDSSAQASERECLLRTDSEDDLPVAISTSLLRDKRHNPIGLVLVVRDLREIASLRRRLIVSDRLAAVGHLAAGIAHEINNPIAFVRANLGGLHELIEILASKLPASILDELREPLAEGRELIEESLDGVDRVAAIVRDVKSFSHAGEARLERVALNPLLDAVLRVSAPQLPAGCNVERRYGDLPEICSAPQELQQVFLNLVVNAAQAIESGATIRITTRVEGDRAIVLVEDDGCGIAREKIEYIFDPFFTTKAIGEGTGLGLAISYQIVRNHGGDLSVESSPGNGACFRVALPIGGPPA